MLYKKINNRFRAYPAHQAVQAMGSTASYLKSWQGGGRLQGFLKQVDMPLTALFWLSTLICLASAYKAVEKLHRPSYGVARKTVTSTKTYGILKFRDSLQGTG